MEISQKGSILYTACALAGLLLALPQYHQLHAGLQTSLDRYGTPFSGWFTCCSTIAHPSFFRAFRRNLNQLLHTFACPPFREARERTCVPRSPPGSAVARHMHARTTTATTQTDAATHIGSVW